MPDKYRADLLSRLRSTLQTRTKPAADIAVEPSDDPGAPEYAVQNGVAMISVVGAMTSWPTWMDEYVGLCPVSRVEAELAAAVADDSVEAIAILFDSPGGYSSAGGNLADAIAAANKRKPVYAIARGLLCSAAYWAASQCREIFAQSSTEVGCIGTYCLLVDDTKFWEEMGVSWEVIGSGGVKGMGADGRITDELRDETRRIVKDFSDQFVANVAAGRNVSPSVAKSWATGQVWLAGEAKQMGLIDAVASSDAAMQAITQRTIIMNMEAFKAFAAEHPEAVAPYVDQGRKAGTAEACNDERARARAIAEACPGRPQLALDSFIAGREAADVAETVKALDAEARAHAEQIEQSRADQAARDAENERLRAELAKANEKLAFVGDGQGAIGTGRATKPDDKAKPSDDPKAQAEWEWDNEPESHAGFSSKERYVAYRTAELKGKIRAVRSTAEGATVTK